MTIQAAQHLSEAKNRPQLSLAAKKEPQLTAAMEKAKEKLSPFELKNELISYAKKYESALYPSINVGRGNPNFFNTTARLALDRLTTFAISFSPEGPDAHLGYIPGSAGIAKAFFQYIEKDSSPAGQFLKNAMKKAIEICTGSDKVDTDAADDVVYELANSSIGDFYPDPPRIYPNVEKIVNRYLENTLLNDETKNGQFQLFATEGATAGMVYAFKSLQENFLLNKGDTVAIITPVFSPYLEIPKLNDFKFKVVYLDTMEHKRWELPDSELKKLKDPSIKVLYLINPTNPTSVALSDRTIELLEHIVKKHNPNLVILVDAVYATFVKHHTSIIQRMPFNCITVYSYSKYFGVTGWRLGVVMINENNVIDSRLLKSLSDEQKRALAKRYRIDTLDIENVPFIERMVYDSRDVALAHTAGISGPQQVVMALFSLFGILDAAKQYRADLWQLLQERMDSLYSGMAFSQPTLEQPTNYYSLIDVLALAEKKYSREFAMYLIKNYYPVDLVYALSIYTSTICLPGYGFFESERENFNKITPADRNNWSIRVSLANQNSGDLARVGEHIVEVLAMYHDEYRK